MKRLICLFIIILYAGCVDTHSVMNTTPAGREALSPDSSFFIAVPKDGMYGSTIYENSGLMTSQEIYSAVSQHASRVIVGDKHQSFGEAEAFAKDSGYQYLIYSTILNWEDRATEWSGKRDKVKVKIDVVDLSKGLVANSTIIEGKSKWASFGGDHPQQLLADPIEEYFSSVFANP